MLTVLASARIFYWVFIIETTLNFAVRLPTARFRARRRMWKRIYGLISHGFWAAQAYQSRRG